MHHPNMEVQREADFLLNDPPSQEPYQTSTGTPNRIQLIPKPCKTEPTSTPLHEPDNNKIVGIRLPLEEAIAGIKRKPLGAVNLRQLSIKASKYTADQEGTESGRLTKPSTERFDDFLLRIGLQRKNRKLFKILNCSTKDCLFCPNANNNHSKESIRSVITNNLNKKYLTTRESYNAKVINDIVYNENTHLVSVFKDYLIYDDISEYLKRFYARHETKTRLPKIYDFYDKYSKVFPNYVVLPENKLMFKNIERKQRVIDEEQHNAEKAKKKEKKMVNDSDHTNNKVFTTLFLKELNKPNTSISQCLDSSEEKEKNESQLQSFLRRKAKKVDSKKTKAKLNELSLEQLVDKFISKDSQSLIDFTDAIRKINEQDHSLPEAPSKPTKELYNHVRTKSETTKYPNASIKALIASPQKDSLTRLHSPVEQTSSRNSASGNGLAKGGVWSTLKGRMASHRTSSELHVKTIVSGNVPVIVTKRGSGTRAEKSDSRAASHNGIKVLERIKSPNIFVWNERPAALETYPITIDLKGIRLGSKVNQAQMKMDLSPSRAKETINRRMISSNRPGNPTGHGRVPSMQTKAEIYGARNAPGIFSAGNVLIDTGTAKKKKNVVIEMEALRGSRSAKPESSKFKSDYLNKLQNKNQRIHAIIEKPRIDRAETTATKGNNQPIIDLAYSKSMGVLDRNYTNHLNSGSVMRGTNTRQGSRNTGITTKTRRSGSYNKIQGSGRGKRV